LLIIQGVRTLVHWSHGGKVGAGVGAGVGTGGGGAGGLSQVRELKAVMLAAQSSRVGERPGPNHPSFQWPRQVIETPDAQDGSAIEPAFRHIVVIRRILPGSP